MKIITKKKAIKYIEKEIDSLNVECFRDKHEAFDYMYAKMELFYDMDILNKKELDVLWDKLTEKTGL